jgi:hypothetical protein
MILHVGLEDDQLVYTIQELGLEVAANLVHHQLAHVCSSGLRVQTRFNKE